MGLQNYLNNCSVELVSEEGKILCRNLVDSIKKRLYPYEGRSITKLATILDPRFKKEGFQNPENAVNAAAILEQEMCSIVQKKAEPAAVPSTSEKSSRNISLLGFLKQRIDSKTKSVTADVIITKRQYLERSNSSEDTDPLLFWKVGCKYTKYDRIYYVFVSLQVKI